MERTEAIMPTPDTEPASTGWMLTILVTAIVAIWGCLYTVVKYVEKMFSTELTELKTEVKCLKKDVADCQEDRFALAVRIASIEKTQKQPESQA